MRKKCIQSITRFFSTLSHSGNLRRTTSVIANLAVAGDLSAAIRFLRCLPAPDAAAWNAIISGAALNGRTQIAFQLFDEMPVRPDAFTLSSLLKASGLQADLELTQNVHGLGIKLGLSSNPFVVTGLLDNYSKVSKLYSSEKCFKECFMMDTVVWSAMIAAYARNRQYELVLEVFARMRDSGLGLNKFVFASVFAALADEGCSFEQGKVIHCLSLKMGFLSGGSITLRNALLDMYCKFGEKNDSYRAFEEIEEPDVVSWSTFMGIMDGVEALHLFAYLFSRDPEINEYTVINVLSAIEDTNLLTAGRQIQACCYKLGFNSFISVGNVLISMYGKCWQIDDAIRLFDEMIEKDSVTWNALLSAFADNSMPIPALETFSQMRYLSLQPSVTALTSVLDAISNSYSLKEVARVHSHIIKVGYMSSDCMITTLITIYGKCDSVEESKKVFLSINGVSKLHIDAMMATLVQASSYTDALKLFRDCRSVGIEVDCTSLSIGLKACCSMTAVEQGRNMHSLVLKLGMDGDQFMVSAIINLYSKCGLMSDAVKAFDTSSNDNLASWNAMITGHAQSGDCKKAIDLFREMLTNKMDPDEITFLSVLYACCHGGYVKEANYYLNLMFEEHGIVPSLEHYACVVDLLGRAGQLDEARNIINQLPVTPDAKMWQIFLTGCSIHKDLELGELAAQELLKIEPDNDSAHIMLSNIYAMKGIWNEVQNIRRGMKDKTISKEPGCSWIQLKGGVDLFYANDLSHPKTRDILMVLEELYGEIVVSEIDKSVDVVDEQDSAMCS